MHTLTYFLTSTTGGDLGNFWTNMEHGFGGFFKDGLGGPGAKGIGIAILVIGFVCAGISFAAHKFNPQSKLPGWVSCIAIGIVGAILMGGIEQPIKLFEQARGTLYSWLGLTSNT